MAIDPDKIFNLFGDNNGESSNKPSKSKVVDNMDENHPNYFIGMFIKLVLNHLNYTEELIHMFKESDPNLGTKQIEQAGEVMLYGRAYFYAENIDITDSYHVGLLLKDKDNVILACQLAIKYFEEIEEYEKCAYLKKIVDFLLK